MAQKDIVLKLLAHTFLHLERTDDACIVAGIAGRIKGKGDGSDAAGWLIFEGWWLK